MAQSVNATDSINTTVQGNRCSAGHNRSRQLV